MTELQGPDVPPAGLSTHDTTIPTVTRLDVPLNPEILFLPWSAVNVREKLHMAFLSVELQAEMRCKGKKAQADASVGCEDGLSVSVSGQGDEGSSSSNPSSNVVSENVSSSLDVDEVAGELTHCCSYMVSASPLEHGERLP
jgi:hypothetical protein